MEREIHKLLGSVQQSLLFGQSICSQQKIPNFMIGWYLLGGGEWGRRNQKGLSNYLRISYNAVTKRERLGEESFLPSHLSGT